MNLFVDTSVWSLALRRDRPSEAPAHEAVVGRLADALGSGEAVFTTGLVLQELLQGFSGLKAREVLLERFSYLPLLVPDRADHIAAAELRNQCRRHGIAVGTIDALLAQLCVRHDLLMLTVDLDFARMVAHTGLRIWGV